ncbi:MAG: hypothetical protein LUC90_03440 [Lachnospiraceae bacterium]|nr:hypothetical protein [Lachnospiraceae bacterium]
MRNRFLSCADQLRHLMETHNPKLKNAADLSRAMHEMGIFEYSDKPGITKEESIRYKARTINSHLDGRQIDIGFLIAYCDFFHCSADYLLGYISSPTHAATDIVKETGLWEENINALDEQGTLFLNAIISSKAFSDLKDDFWSIVIEIARFNIANSELCELDGEEDAIEDFSHRLKEGRIQDLSVSVLKDLIHENEKRKNEILQRSQLLRFRSVFHQGMHAREINQLTTDFGNFVKQYGDLNMAPIEGGFTKIYAEIYPMVKEWIPDER